MSGAAQSSWKPPEADRQVSGWTPPASDRAAPANAEGDALKQKGFFESAWDVVKSVPAAAVEMLTPHSRAEKEAQIQKALQFADRFVSAHQGGDEAAKKAANDELMLALPGGSTIYKAKEGNYAGAAGDIAGMAVLGGVAKAAANPAETAAIAKGGARGAVRAAKETIPITKLGIDIPLPKPLVTGAATSGALRAAGVPTTAAMTAGVVAGGAPIVRAAIRGARAELAKLAPAVERPAPAWQRLAEIPENAPSPLADLSAKLQAIIDERNARALERQQTSLPPALERMVTKAKEAESLTPEQEALASEILQNVEPAPEAVPPAAAAPAAPAGLPAMEEILAAPPARGTTVSPALLEDVAQGQAGKPFRELGQADQVKVIEIARRIQSEPAAARPNLPPEEPPPAPIAATPETVPPAPPVGTLAETPATAPAAEPNVFVKNARLAKAVRVADAAQELGLTREDAYKMIADVEKRNEFAKRIGEKSISPDTMALVVDKIAKAESAVARAAAPAPKPTPVSQALAKFKAEKAKKPKAK